MNIGSFVFKKICNISLDREAGGSIKEFMPQSRYKNQKGLSLNNYGHGPFCKFKIPRNLNDSGVYAIVINDEIKYIGKCVNLSSRFNNGYGNISPRNCFAGGQETNCRINNQILHEAIQGNEISLWFFETEDYKSIEDILLSSNNPDWNKT